MMAINCTDEPCTSKRMTIEETYSALLEINKLKARNREITAHQLQNYEHLKHTPKLKRAKAQSLRNAMLHGVIGLIVGIYVPFINTFVSMIFFGLLFTIVSFVIELKSKINSEVKKEFQENQSFIKNTRINHLKEQQELTNNIRAMEETLHKNSIVPVAYQTEMHLSQMLFYKQHGYSKTDEQAIRKTIENFMV